MRKNKGFTLIEMLIVTAMLAVVSLAVYATFDSGIKIWKRVNQEMPSEDMDIFFDKFTSDLRNTLKAGNISPSGQKDEFELPVLVNSRRLGISPGKVRYRFDHAKGGVIRQRMDYSDIYDGGSGSEELSMRNVKSLKFQYYIYDDEKQEYLWQDELTGQVLPLAVRVELELKDNGQTGKFTKTAGIPVS